MAFDFKDNQSSSKTPQIIAAFTASIGGFALGQALSWTSPVLPHIADCGDQCEVKDLGKEVGSWIGSLLAVGNLTGVMIAGFLMSRLGLRWTIILMTIPFTVGWVVLFVTKPFNMASPIMFYVGRILTGMGGGSFAFLAPVYTAETAEKTIRGAMGSIMHFMLTIGILFNNSVGALISWTTLTAICTISPILLALGMLFMPDSPFFLIAHGREPEAKAALQWLRGSHCDVTNELQNIKSDVNKKHDLGEVSLKMLLSTGHYFKPLLVILLLMFFQQYSGRNAVLFYLQDLFQKAGTDMNPGLSSSLVCFAEVLVTAGAVIMVDKFGRRILLFVSALFMGISLLGLALFFYLDSHQACNALSKTETVQCIENGFDPQLVKSLGPLPLTSLITYVVAFSIGFVPLPWMINGEFFSLEAKAKATTVAGVFNWSCAFLVSKFQVNMETLLTTAGSYTVYAAFCFLSLLFLTFVVPESRGKTPEEMKIFFQKNQSN